jgi:anti-anti-sigma factor
MTVDDDGADERCTVTSGLHEDLMLVLAVGELDHGSAGRLHLQVKDAWATAPSSALVMDLSGLTFCDSTGLRAEAVNSTTRWCCRASRAT